MCVFIFYVFIEIIYILVSFCAIDNTSIYKLFYINTNAYKEIGKKTKL